MKGKLSGGWIVRCFNECNQHCLIPPEKENSIRFQVAFLWYNIKKGV
jgi:hypothetical protein